MNLLEKCNLPTQYGEFEMLAIQSPFNHFPHTVLVSKPIDYQSIVLVRIHSECMTGDVFSSARCDCGEQLNQSLELIGKESGLLIYLRQEGRGIGLVNKMKAYNLQDSGLDTFQANIKLGFHQDERNFDIAIEILKWLDIKKIELITNNPEKLKIFENSGIELVKRRALNIADKPQNQNYLKAKKDIGGHLL